MTTSNPPAALAARPTYDVAISFLSRDTTLAGEIEAKLSEAVKVFYFPRVQELLAGTDGLESMRVPFVSGARRGREQADLPAQAFGKCSSSRRIPCAAR